MVSLINKSPLRTVTVRGNDPKHKYPCRGPLWAPGLQRTRMLRHRGFRVRAAGLGPACFPMSRLRILQCRAAPPRSGKFGVELLTGKSQACVLAACCRILLWQCGDQTPNIFSGMEIFTCILNVPQHSGVVTLTCWQHSHPAPRQRRTEEVLHHTASKSIVVTILGAAP